MPVILITNHYNEVPLSILQEAIPKGFKLISLKQLRRNYWKRQVKPIIF